jgi:hypothetical protein
MGLPNNVIYIQGQTQVGQDDLNTFVQAAFNVATLRQFIGLAYMTVYLLGFSVPGDGGAGEFYWNPTATGPDDGEDIIVPTGALVGAWIRLSSSNPNGAGQGNIHSVVTSNYALAADDFFVPVDATTSAISILLPPAASVGMKGKIFKIMKLDGTANLVTFVPSGSDVVVGTSIAAFQNQAIEVQSDGASKWYST